MCDSTTPRAVKNVAFPQHVESLEQSGSRRNLNQTYLLKARLGFLPVKKFGKKIRQSAGGIVTVAAMRAVGADVSIHKATLERAQHGDITCLLYGGFDLFSDFRIEPRGSQSLDGQTRVS